VLVVVSFVVTLKWRLNYCDDIICHSIGEDRVYMFIRNNFFSYRKGHNQQRSIGFKIYL